MFNPCCCTCDQWNYESSNATSSAFTWSQDAGSWSFAANKSTATTSSNNAIATTGQRHQRLVVQVQGNAVGDTVRGIIDFQDTSNYWFAEWRISQAYLAIGKVVAGVETLMATVDKSSTYTDHVATTNVLWFSVVGDYLWAIMSPSSVDNGKTNTNWSMAASTPFSFGGGSSGVFAKTISGSTLFRGFGSCIDRTSDTQVVNACLKNSVPSQEQSVTVAGVTFPTSPNRTFTAIFQDIYIVISTGGIVEIWYHYAVSGTENYYIRLGDGCTVTWGDNGGPGGSGRGIVWLQPGASYSKLCGAMASEVIPYDSITGVVFATGSTATITSL